MRPANQSDRVTNPATQDMKGAVPMHPPVRSIER